MKKIARVILITVLTMFMSFTGLNIVNAEETSTLPESTEIKSVDSEVENLETTNTEIVSNESSQTNPETGEVTEGTLEPGEIDVDKDAEIISNPEGTPTPTGDSREAEITFEIESESFTRKGNAVKVDVALVIDASGSMEWDTELNGSVGARLDAAKEAAINLVNKLYASEDVEFRIALVTFSGEGSIKLSLTGETEKTPEGEYLVNDKIDEITTSSSTNVQDGIEKGASTLTSTTNHNVMILLTDGAANRSARNVTYYTAVKSTLNGKISNSCYNYGTRYCSDEDWALITAEYYRNIKNITYYTIAFAEANADTLKKIAGDDSRFIGANNGDELVAAFEKFATTITEDIVATDVVLTDIIPNEFELTETEKEKLTNTYGDKIKIETVNEGTKITYNIGKLTSTEDVTFKYKVLAKEDYHGSIFTNVSASLTGIKADGSPFTFIGQQTNENGKVVFTLTPANPSVLIPAITSNDDAGSVKENSSKTILNSEILNNDKVNNLKVDNATSIKDEIVIVSGPTNGTLTKSETGYIYTPTNFSATTDSYTYKILTTVTYSDGTTESVSSNVSTVSLSITQVTGNLNLIYKVKNTTTELDNDTINNLEYNTLVQSSTYNQNFAGYKFDSVSATSLTIQEGINTITYYYIKDDSQVKEITYTVEYYKDGEFVEDYDVTKEIWINDTTGLVDTIDTANDKYLGYKFEKTTPTTLPTTFADGDVFKVYYIKDDSQVKEITYYVNYYKDGKKVVEDSYFKTKKVWVNDPDTTVLETVDQSNDKYLGYKFEKTTPTTLPAAVKNNDVIDVYYIKRTDLNYTVNYLDLDTKEKIAESKLSNAIFEDEILSSEEVIDIERYRYDSADVEKIIISVDVEKNVINLYYSKIMGKVIVNHIDEDGKEIASSVIIENQIGETYKTSEVEVDDYILKTVEGETTGTHTEEDIIVTYIYETAGTGGDDVVPTGLNDTLIAEIMFIVSVLSLSIGLSLKKVYSK